MDVLQAAISIVGRNYSKIGLHTCAPDLLPANGPRAVPAPVRNAA
jgi:hypothetical protein